MNSVRNEDISDFIEKKISEYDEKLLDGLKKLKLKDVLKRKNPYLFKAKGITSPYELIRPLLDAFLSSKEEAVFGGVLEEIAININNRVYGGMKSAAEGIDLEFNKDGKKYLVSIKSGPNWGNSSQIKRMVDNFNKAKKILRTTNNNDTEIIAINGCCYGIDRSPYKKEGYYKLCGAKFWEFITGNQNFHRELIAIIAKDKCNRIKHSHGKYEEVIANFEKDFSLQFCTKNGDIDWDKIIALSSEE
ncbi:hypothetical protein LA366_17360 [Aeromonas jandaei]|uniref:Type II restriction endonuclease EcoO109IR domain-containing protein n=1 Tax=Aeromonas jandaei TaxID=650 RepID=A0A7T4A6J2_AERJA|nr:PmeII family type II restriction endonuclease [Aeromonas jandaei]QQB18167.1 hypothetical protein I6H43_11135 [Aeromonas jandaei]UCA32836.1 hypothetical protein LA366_17360 [Aeromonas jandaei]